MLSKLVEYDKLLDSLVKKSAFTTTQIDTLLCYVTSRQVGSGLERMISVRDKNQVTKGSFLRTLRQAQGNFRSSLFSIFLMSYLGLIDDELIDGFIRIVKMLNEFGKTGHIENYLRVIDVINQICDRLSYVI